MKRLLVAMAMLCVSLAAVGQNAAVNGFCTAGGKPAKTQGAFATNFQQEIIPSCTVTVYLTGTLTLATLVTSTGSAAPNPFTANALGAVAPGQWIFYAAQGVGLDIVLSGGISPNVFLLPVTITDVIPGGGGGGGGGNPAPPSFAVQLANSGATAFAADPNITINPTLHTLTVGPGGGASAGIIADPLPFPGASPSGAFQRYGGLPTIMNVMTDCSALTGLPVVGDGSTSDTTAVQQCIWQRIGVCPTPGVTCTPATDPVTATTCTGGVCTLTSTNVLAANQTVFLTGFAGNTCFNGKHYVVLATGLSGSQFEVTSVCTGTSTETTANAITPADRRFETINNANQTGVTFFFPQRRFNATYGAGCSYYLPGGIDLPWDARIEGEGYGFSRQGTILCFADGDTFISARSYNHVSHLTLLGADPFTPTSLATYILPTGFGGSGVGYGIQSGGDSTYEDVYIYNAGSNGFNCDSSSTWIGNPTTNQCDLNSLRGVTSQHNRGQGFYFHGGDAGVSSLVHAYAQSNQLYGFYDNSLYAETFVEFLSDGNGEDETTFTGTIPSISSTSCSTTVCTVTTSSAHGLNPGDLIQNSSCSDTGLNGPSKDFILTTASGSTYTFPYVSPTGAETPTGCVAVYRLGTHVWAAAGNTVAGRNAAGGCVYGPQGHYVAPYCEGDQPTGTFQAGVGTGDIVASLVENPQGTATFAPYGAKLSVDNSLTVTSGNLDLPYQSTSGVRLDNNDTNGGIFLTLENIEPGGSVEEEGAIYSQAYLRRTFYGPGQNGSSNLSNWDCFMLTGTFTGSLTKASGCFPDQTINGITAVNVTAGGTGYTSPTYNISNNTGDGSGALITCTLSGGVIQNPCTIVAPGAGYNPNAVITVYDPTGTGAAVSATVGNVISTDSGRSALNALGLWYMPQNFCFGTSGSFVPAVCWTTGTAAPVSGSWKLNDFVYNTSGGEPFGWICIAAGTPGTWTELVFGSDSNNAIVPFSNGSATNMTSGNQYYFVNGSTTAGSSVPVTFGVSVPFSGLLRNFKVSMSSTVAASNSVLFTIYDGGSTTGITCTMGTGTNVCTDSSDTFSVSPFDVLAVVMVCTGTCGANSTFLLQASAQLQ